MKVRFVGAKILWAAVLIWVCAREAAAQQKSGADAKSAGPQGKAVSGEAEPAKDLEAAKTTFMAAQRLFSQQKFDEALPLFREAFEISRSPNATMMIGNCLVMMGRTAEAYEALSKAMLNAAKLAESEEKYVPTRDAAAQQLAALETKVGKVVVAFADSKSARVVSVNGAPIGAERVGTPIAVEPGAVVITAAKPGQDPSPLKRDIAIAAGETKTVVFGSRTEDNDSANSWLSFDSKTLLNLRTFGYVAVGVGLTGMALLAGAGISAMEDLSTLEQECGGQRCVDDRHVGIAARGRTLTTVSNVGLGIGIAGLVAGAGLITFSILADESAPEAKSPSALSIMPGLGSMALRGSF